VSLRLGVKAGSLNEADDQLGLAHLIEHMAFNGSAHFKPGELVKYFETVGARLGPHVNAYTSFDETVYMFDVPSDQPEIVEKALTALSDFAGGLSLSQQEVDKERGVVIEEWRGGTRCRIAHPRQAISDSVLSLAVRGSAADWQAGRHPQRPGGAAAGVL
jgi:zinc protease